MIPAINWLWRQLNGPQVTAFATAITAFMRNKFNNTMNYFNTLSIETANDSHLTIIGALQNIARPVFQYARTEFFYFTENPGHNSEHGFSEIGGSVGGKFSGARTGDYVRRRLNTAEYRALLLILKELGTDATGLVFLDRLCDFLWKTYARDNTQPNPTTFHVCELGEYPNRGAGDIVVTMGVLQDYNDPTAVAGIINMVSDILYEPQPTLFPVISA